MKNTVWSVIGGGNGGQTLAGNLALLGYKVRLFSKSADKVNAINKTKKIILRHEIEGVAEIEFATTNMEKAIKGATNIVIVLPSTWHEMTAKMMIPYLEDGQNILLLPEASCGAIAFRKYMSDLGCNAEVVVGVGATLPYATRILQEGEVYVYGVKDEVKIAAFPAKDNSKLEEAFCSSLPCFKLCQNVIETSIDNINALMHPAPTLLNVARIEANPPQSYEYYRDGVTPTICKIIEEMDRERIAIAKEFGLNQRTIAQEYIDMYSCGKEGDSLFKLLQNNDAYNGLMNLPSLESRYVMEDLPYSIVAISALGKVVGVPTPCIDTIISLGRFMLGDKLDEGRTLEHLGLTNTTKEELIKLVNG